MDKSWVRLNRGSANYKLRLRGWISHVLAVASFHGNIKCPCRSCVNGEWHDGDTVYDHLVVEGIDHSYIDGPWVWHGEAFGVEQPVCATYGEDTNSGMADMIHDLFPSIDGQEGPCENENNAPTSEDENHGPSQPMPDDVHRFRLLLEEANQDLYPGCRAMKKLEFLIEVFQNKCLYGQSDVSVSAWLKLIKKILPEGETLPTNFYRTKKIVKAFELKCEKIDACRNDCMLYWKQNSSLDACLTCGTSRYTEEIGNNSSSKKKRVPQKVLSYFPITPRLQRLYMSQYTAEDMAWHSDKRPSDGNLRHPADSQAWKHLDTKFPDFGSEGRNVRLGLASDGFNPFGDMSSSHSTWPVILTVYNLPPWKCMKQPYMMMALLIPGPRSPGNDIDVYLEPLIDELKSLWENGIPTYDAFKKETFNMRAAVMWTINDFPAYANLSGWSTKGKLACPNCNYNTRSTWLPHGKKHVYMAHRRFLPLLHRFRRYRKSFNLSAETDRAPTPMTGSFCLRRLSKLRFKFGKPPPPKVGQKRPAQPVSTEGPWKKRSIFFELPYWEHLLIRHNLDVMHIEKNVCESLLGTLLEASTKNKDTIKARLDMQLMGIKPDLWPVTEGNKTELPLAEYTMTSWEKELFCMILASIRVPDNYSSNIARHVNVKERTIHGLKSHDCHVIMQQLLPLMVRRSLPSAAAKVLMELSAFFRHLCSKNGSVEHFLDLKRRIAMVLCQMEKMMPPSFFDVMVHLPIHLAEEAALAGPVFFRWMYPIERYLYTLQKYVRNRNRPEGSIAQGYLSDESMSFCAMYLEDVLTRRNRPSRNEDGVSRNVEGGLSIFQGGGRALGAAEEYQLNDDDWESARSCVLANCPEAKPYERRHVREAQANRGRRVTLLQSEKRAKKSFPNWFDKLVNGMHNEGDPRVTEDLLALANGPSKWCSRYKSYVSNGFRFKVRNGLEDGKRQNWGVWLQAEMSSYATANDCNHREGMVGFYGALVDIIELQYRGDRNIVLFKCDWPEVNSRGGGVKKDEFGFTLVNFNKCMGSEDPYVFASHAIQAMFVKDPTDVEWHVAIKTRPRDFFDMSSTPIEDPCSRQDLEHVTGDDDHLPIRTDVRNRKD